MKKDGKAKRPMRTRRELEETRDLWLRLATTPVDVGSETRDRYHREAELIRWVLNEGDENDEIAKAEDLVRKEHPQLYVLRGRKQDPFFREGEIVTRAQGDIIFLGSNWLNAAERIRRKKDTILVTVAPSEST